ncbi:hypothetical protein B7494_g655 [Chlorociboria aeruginascens]|nr:hypothetical protein B7494_g655 [Chlorociboria aeruginascens]
MLLSRFPWYIRRSYQYLRKYSTNATIEESILPDPQTFNHHDLPSFLEYAKRIEMDQESTVYRGTHYEYTVQIALKRLGIFLQHTGGKSDSGIDLLGTWSLPNNPQPLKVFVQCKALAEKVKPSVARELEGTFAGAPQGWRGSGVLALLVTQKAATKGVREALGQSRWPMAYVLCNSKGNIFQMMWNKTAKEQGLEGLEVGLRYTGGEQTEKEIVLTWKGAILNE